MTAAVGGPVCAEVGVTAAVGGPVCAEVGMTAVVRVWCVRRSA